VVGLIKTVRSQKDITFIKLNDGSHPAGLQLVYSGNEHLTLDTSIRVVGKLVVSEGAGQPFDLIVDEITVIGSCNPDDYPLAKAKMTLEYLRGFPHLRPRTSTIGSVMRIVSEISFATTMFFKREGYIHTNPNIITTNECEGGAGVFQLTEKDISYPLRLLRERDISGTLLDTYDWKRDHFGVPTFLTTSSQLQLECTAVALGPCYTTNKSFRSEHSSTNKHLSEFPHLEIEVPFVENADLMDIGEQYIKYVVSHLLKEMGTDIDNLGSYSSKGLRERLETVASCKFHRITYAEAIKIAQEAGRGIVYGEDLSSDIENCLTDTLGGPVFVYNWPIAIKSFYMKQDETDVSLCNNFDLLMPYKIGELIGGSMREDNYDKLISMMTTKGLDANTMSFYTDMRKFGTVPHGGFGLGSSRLAMLCTGMENIRDVEPVPVAYKTRPL
jgi:asparaginyl-tRNA synthetase